MNRSTRGGGIVAAGVLAVAAGLASAAGATGEEAPIRNKAGDSPAGRVVKARTIAMPGSAAIVRLWDEVAPSGAVTHWHAVSTDGRAFSRAIPTTYEVRLRYADFDPLATTPVVAQGLVAPAETRSYLVQFVAPPIEPMRDGVRALGGTVHRFLTDHTHIVHLPPGAAAKVAALPFVRWVGPYHTAYRLEESILADAVAGADAPRPERFLIEMLERGPAAQEAVAARVRALGGEVNLMLPQGFRIEATMPLETLLHIAAMDQVLFVGRWGPPGEDMNIARQIGGAEALEAAHGYTGQGVRAEVMDSGIRATHVAFQTPAALIHGTNNLDFSHGTCVYGIVFGSGVGNPSARGMLAGREQGIFSSFYGLTNRYTHSQELVASGGAYRAVFQTNSWGSAQGTTYTPVTAEMDDIIFDLDLLITQSQSNTGNQQSRPQAWAKNIVSIGGVVHKNTLARADDLWQGASIGPAADGRVKPDLTHFYDLIACTGSASDTAYVTDFGGTSGATPIVAGHFGLLFQMWHEGAFAGFGGGSTVFNSRPRFSTAKAVMINTAYQYPFTMPTANLSRVKQGWGMPDLARLDAFRDQTFIVNETDLVTPGGARGYVLAVAPGTEVLKITMTYADPQGTTSASQHRINDLSLRATSPSGVVYWGNNGLLDGVWSVAAGQSNTKDTVENVFIPLPAPGNWLVEVLGDQIVQDGHVQTPALDADFALVAHPVELQLPVEIALPNGAPTLLAPGTPAVIDVEVTPGFQTPAPATARLFYRASGAGAFTESPLTHAGGTSYTATLPPFACGQTPNYYFSAAGDGGGTVTLPTGAPLQFYAAEVGTILTLHQHNFEQDPGWTVENTLVQDGPWERGTPAGGGGLGDPPTDYDGSGQCWVTGLAAASDVDGGPTVLTSPVFNLTGVPLATVRFARWMYTNEPTTSDNLVVEISNNGGASWQTVESIGGAIQEWKIKFFRVSDHFTPNANVRLRFSVKDDPLNSLTEAAIDDFRITTFSCTNICYPDCNASGNLTVADFGCFQGKYVLGDPYADCNNSGTLTVADFGCYQGRYVLGCP
ncbi:MAG: S8 family serine peptidase [Phycisphaerales bacterium]